MKNFKLNEQRVYVSTVMRNSLLGIVVKIERRKLRVLLADDIEETEINQADLEEESSAAQNQEVEKIETREVGDLVELDLKLVIGFSMSGTV